MAGQHPSSLATAKDIKLDAVHVDDKQDHVKAEKTQHVLESAWAHTPPLTLARLFWKAILICAGILAGALFDGYAVTVPSSIAANKSFTAAFGTVVWKTGTKSLNAKFVSAWGGMSSGLQIFGMLTAGQTSDRFGRKLNLAFVCMFLSVAIVLELCAKNWIYFLMARGLAGWGTGMAKATLTCYVAEIAPSGLRGSVLTMYSFMYALGQFSCAIALEIVQLKSLSWRNAFFAEIVFLALYVPVAIFAPESPWYYANKYDHDGAKRMLLKINGNVPGYDVEHEYAVIAGEVEHNAALAAKSAAVSWFETFKGINGRRTWISFLPLTTQQLVGSPFVFSYLSYFFSIAGVANPFLPTVASNTILLGGLVVAAFTVDKLGRRPLLLVSETINMVTILFMGVIGTFSKRNDGALSSTQSNAIVALACIWVAAYSMGPAPLGYAYAAETSTPVLRAKTTALATAMCGAFALAFTYCTPIMLSAQEANWGIEGVGYFYACLAFLGLIGVYFTIPETRKRTFAELDELFETKVPARKFASTKTSFQSAEQGGGEV